MKPRLSPFVAALITFSALATVVSLPVAAADEPAAAEKPAASKAKAKRPTEEEAMKAWQAYITPGEAHKRLATSEGTWRTKVKVWMDPSKPPDESEGTVVAKMALGGRFLEERYEGTMMGQPFSGIGYSGYDNYTKKYVSSWIDTGGTGIMTMTGAFDKAGKVMTSFGTMDDPIARKMVKVKAVTTFVDDDTHRFEMWNTGPGGKMVKSMEMVYTRQK